MTSSVVISEVNDLMYVVLIKEDKHVLYGKTVATTECIPLQTKCPTNRGPYHRVKLQI
jgi:hypothetical protein